jgi:hypothetical protein
MPRQILPPIIAAAATLAIAGAAHAQPLDLRLPDASASPAAPLPVTRPVGVAAAPVPDLENPLDPLAPTTRVVKPLETAVFARTSVEHRFAGHDNLTGALGFLCGLQPGHNESGGAAAYGVDPHGRFVGAKFSIAFR